MIRLNGDALHIEGPVTLQTVPELLAGAAPHLAAGVRRIDFSAATEVDSSAVALALEWRRQARDGLVLENLPAAMQNLARLYGVSDLLQAPAR